MMRTAPVALFLLLSVACTGTNSPADTVQLDQTTQFDVVTDVAAVPDVVDDEIPFADYLDGVEPDLETPDSGSELECEPLPTATSRTLEEALADGGLVLGEVVEGSLASTLLFPPGSDGEEYLVILYDLGTARNTTHDYSLELAPTSGENEPQPAAQAPLPKFPLPHRDWGKGPLGPPAAPMPGPLPVVGDVLEFDVPFGYLVKTVEAEVVLVTDELVICNDLTTPNPLEEVSLATMETFATLFETVVLPRERFFWGPESDVNDDGRVTMLFTHLVNESQSYAFVTPCDLQDPGVCGYSNEQEMIYVAIPDPEEQIHSPESYAELIAHEFNHAIYFYRKFLLNDQAAGQENIYLTEGMSGLAQDLTGYNRGNQFVASAGMAEIDSVSLPDLHRFKAGAGYDEERDGALRGASYLFLRYLFDQAGGEDMDAAGSLAPTCGSRLLSRWVNSALTGPELVAEVSGRSYEDVAANWYTALALSNRPAGADVLPVSPVYSYLPTSTDPITGNQRGINLWGNIMGFYPLSGPTMQAASAADGILREGGVEYLIVSADPEGETSLSIDPGTAPDPHVRVVRIK